MTMIKKLEDEIKELKEKNEAQRHHIEESFNNTYKDVLDLNTNRSTYLINAINLLNFDKEYITFLVKFEDEETMYLKIKPGDEIRLYK